MSGTAGDDNLNGTNGDDLLRGFVGDDTLLGAGGNDRLDGGDGSDTLNGELGDDVLLGRDGFIDVLGDDLGGNDKLYGGAGHDRITVNRYTEGAATAVRLDGGDDFDYIDFHSFGRFVDTAVLAGGAGDDRITSTGGRRVTVAAGTGDDRVEIDNRGTDYRIDLGAGTDLLTLLGYGYDYSETGSITIANFAAGPGGDRLGLLHYLVPVLQNWDQAANPFATGHLRLVQRGDDTVLQIDRDGGGDGLVTLLTFSNLEAASLTQRNLGGYPSDGSVPVDEDVYGTAGNDVLIGAGGNDFLSGLGSDDEISGGAGDDHLEGGAGNDTLDGDIGDDIVFGGDGVDSIRAELGGNDKLFGQGGRDRLNAHRQEDGRARMLRLDGGDDVDDVSFFSFGRFVDTVTLAGGAGDDLISNVGGRRTIVAAGSGADVVEIDNLGTSYRISLGTGSDLLTLRGYDFRYSSGGGIEVTDFEAGDDGDRLGLLDYLLAVLQNWDRTTNPFATGHLRLVQQGANAVLQIDRDGGGGDFVTLVTLAGVNADALTDRNLGGYAGDGSAPLGQSMVGTEGDDNISGTSGSDTIRGLRGSDTIDGGAGHDRIKGEEGDDTLNAGTGNDILVGGEGYDRLFDSFGGNDVLLGGSEIDLIIVQRRDDLIATRVTLDGGDGNDFLSLDSSDRFLDVARMIGGDGADEFLVRGGRRVSISGGAGSDSVDIDNLGTHYSIRLGSGSDLLEIQGYDFAYSTAGSILLVDFEAGNQGDRLGLLNYLVPVLENWNQSDNPFASGHLRLAQQGSSAVLEIDRNGGADEFERLLTFGDTDAATLTPVNLGGYTRGAIADMGGSGNDRMIGGDRKDVLIGLAGHDMLDGRGGADQMEGGRGNDLYRVDHVGDRALERAASGADAVLSTVSFSLAGGFIESLSLLGTNSLNGVGNGLRNTINGNGAANVLRGAEEADRLSGGGGDDRIFGGAGHDTLRGGAGEDGFFLDTAPGIAGVDSLVDFSAADDTIRLDRTVFTGLVAGGPVGAGAFVLGSTARDADDRILYDQPSGRIFYDGDGAGGAAKILVAMVGDGTALTHADFVGYG